MLRSAGMLARHSQEVGLDCVVSGNLRLLEQGAGLIDA
jgi:hypothetical protein